MSILLSPSFLIFVLLIVLNFVLIFSGQTPLQLLAGIFTFSLFVAAVLTLIGVAWGSHHWLHRADFSAGYGAAISATGRVSCLINIQAAPRTPDIPVPAVSRPQSPSGPLDRAR